MSNTILEELEIEELSQKLMLNLSPRILKEEKIEEDIVNAMIIDDDNNDYINNNFMSFGSKKNSDHKERNYDFNHNEPLCKNLNRKISKDNNNNNLSTQVQLNRSSSLPPSNNYFKGLNLFKKREIKTVNKDYNKEKYNYNYLNQFPHDLNRNSHNNFSKKMNIENTQEFIRLIFNIIIIFVTLYIIFGIIFIIKNDIESKIQISITNILDEMNICSKHYVDNKCQPEQRVPAMELKCTEWERCMSQNPTIIARKSIFTAQIIGEIINTFFDQISFKSASFIFGFIIALIIGNYFVISSAFNFNKNFIHNKNSLDSKSIIKKNN